MIYFSDLGLRNHAIGLFENFNSLTNHGFLFQNFVFTLLKEKLQFKAGRINFWRTTDKAEVDFVLDLGNEIVPIEVKFKELKKPEVGRSLKNFISKYQPSRAWIINLGYTDKVKMDKTEIRLLPFYDLMDREIVL